MAQIVAGFGVPHTPIFPHFVKRDGPDCEIAKLFGAQKAQLAAERPNLIVMFDTDHLNTFFLDSLPIFAVGGPRMAPGRSDGVPDPDWAMRVVKYLEEQKIDRLIAEATQHQLLKAGNVGGELLNWIAMLGAIGDRKPDYVAPQMQNGHAYGVWRWN